MVLIYWRNFIKNIYSINLKSLTNKMMTLISFFKLFLRKIAQSYMIPIGYQWTDGVWQIDISS